ncbi:MAG: SDR family NAD(P)-dependent oxidoreductase [Chloroflexota bacterium]|jgi:NAD(P)-dependent dehydrogenase (short-subunit alcohol dehydrogenase family)
MIDKLSGQVAIVTGAGQPTGAAIARVLAAAGARVALNDLNPDRLARLAAEIRAGGGQVIDITADVSNKFQCVNIIETTRAEWGRIDILVNATSIEPNVSILKMDEWEWMRCLEVNLKGVFLMSQLAGRVMDDQNRIAGRQSGGIIATIARAESPEAGRAAFNAGQAAILAFGRACAREYEPLGIRVQTLVAGGKGVEQTAAEILWLVTDQVTVGDTTT